ncbi:MAG TPA: alpha-hydroxy-acid oxidizing protein [Mycobacterium sp.]|uniref:alpha-hydroxy-acid oxidizing protein n=1 Tax=Mycobacterium sp. TaxID=1785 RepID=UPI002C479297|nr:alpha-hydroxy-acid oxidizing protein [Mycobacterium sp.]HXO82523.1 alpha-hydroxy-acid oxidizing protein [Mycobacterium sp.]
MATNFGDFQNEVYAEAVKGVTTRYPFDFASIERKASEALPDWVYRYVSAAAGDGRTQRANIAAFSCYGIVPRMMVSPPERDLSISLFGKKFVSPMFLAPIGLVGLCAPDFHGDVAAAQASAATEVPYTLSTFTQTRMEDVVPHAGDTPIFYQLYLPDDRELAASLISRAETSGYSALMVTVDSWTLGFRPMDLERGNFPQFRGYCMQNYYTDVNFTKHLAKPPEEDQPAALAHYTKIFANPLSWEDLRWIRTQTKLPIAIKGIQHPDDARLAIDNGADVLYCTNHGGRQANSAVSTLQLLPGIVKAAGSTPVMFDSGVRSATDAIIALALGATAVGLGRPYAYALSYGGAESLTHYLRSFLAELDLCLAVCGFKDIATLKEAGVVEVINSRELLPR